MLNIERNLKVISYEPEEPGVSLTNLLNQHEATVWTLEACGSLPIESVKGITDAKSVEFQNGEHLTFSQILLTLRWMSIHTFNNKT
ncbi:hypothetical protein V5O48_012132 [Marasmius crinis-equi]|uniref:Uncharacterized protein n=1 Tax=Marasmius crinis-equi TaxID=585013 RepID=A0ABR3F3L7_9AGAR